MVNTETDEGLDADVDDGLGPVAQRFWRPIGTQRTLQVVLGLFWLLDAGLQFQSFMFRRSFVETYVLNNAHGQPAVVSWVITNIGHFIEPHIAAWNTLFALTQVVIGLGLLYRPTVRYALALSFAWAFGVWVLGEGMGMVLTGTASALTGAPGSVFMYAMLGLLAWPTGRERGDSEVGVASSAAARGVGGAATALIVWAAYWSLAAVLFLLPQNRSTTSISSAITGMQSGEPSAYGHFLHGVGSTLSSTGTEWAWVLAALSLVIGFGPLLSRRPGVFLAVGGVLSLIFWVTGQGLGGIFTGSGTDPNTGPIIAVLAMAMTPARVSAPYVGATPLTQSLRRHGALTGLALGAVALALFLSADYPAASGESAATAMSGMTGMAGSGSAGAGATGPSTASCSGTNHSGLVVTNSPLMSMGGQVTMNMNGSDASAAAGINSTKANWHYTGPAFPTALAQLLLANGGNNPNQVHMARSGCAAEPTFSDQINAAQYVQATTRAVAPYADPAAAAAAGYQPVSPVNYPVVYYVNPTVVAQNQAAGRTLDPAAVDGLVYATTPSGAQVLVAAMYLLPSTVGTDPPMPYGTLVQWHERTDVCVPTTEPEGTPLTITGFAPCPSGSTVGPTPYLSMVWQVPVAGGPLAIQPSDIQIVEAATMQTSS
ncbi:MAG TPA: hypothetical protein VHS57_08935 [Acidimicrobiales bacterium]|nr:hypothetical protein [Acidimicrobiales bacterium]